MTTAARGGIPRPLFQTPDVAGQERRRLLVVSYHFPPDNAVGGRRWEKLAAYVAERGWGMDVITRYNGVETLDTPRLRALPSGVRVYGVPLEPHPAQRAERWVWELVRGRQATPNGSGAAVGATPTAAVPPVAVDPAVSPAAAKASVSPPALSQHEMRWALHTPRGCLRAYWAWLDFAHIGAWARSAAALGEHVAHRSTHLAVVTSGPPHMSHDAGRRLSVSLGLPFVMDMRDPWRSAEQLPESVASPLWHRLATRHEGRAVRQAALLVANTGHAAQHLCASYPDRTEDIITVMNGADEDPLPTSRRGTRFVIAHAGTLYLDRDPRALFQGAAQVIRELGLTPDDITLEFIGDMEAVGGFPIQEVAEQEGITPYVRTGPLRPHAEAMQFMADAAVLVTMSGTNAAAIPAKTFECMRFDAWLLALSAPGSATEVLLEETDAYVIAPGDASGVARVIRTCYEQYRSGVRPVRIARDGRFSRRSEAVRLLDAIQRLARG